MPKDYTLMTVAEQEEHRERIAAMIEDDGDTWDLSENDKKALRFALACIEFYENTMIAATAQAEGRSSAH
jgi:hypothetical protein